MDKTIYIYRERERERDIYKSKQASINALRTYFYLTVSFVFLSIREYFFFWVQWYDYKLIKSDN